MAYDDHDDDDLDIRRHHQGSGQPIPNYLAQAILVTICCCVPFGIFAIINASKVNTLEAQGEYELAMQASVSAKRWCVAGFIFGVILNPIISALIRG